MRSLFIVLSFFTSIGSQVIENTAETIIDLENWHGNNNSCGDFDKSRSGINLKQTRVIFKLEANANIGTTRKLEQRDLDDTAYYFKRNSFLLSPDLNLSGNSNFNIEFWMNSLSPQGELINFSTKELSLVLNNSLILSTTIFNDPYIIQGQLTETWSKISIGFDFSAQDCLRIELTMNKNSSILTIPSGFFKKNWESLTIILGDMHRNNSGYFGFLYSFQILSQMNIDMKEADISCFTVKLESCFLSESKDNNILCCNMDRSCYNQPKERILLNSFSINYSGHTVIVATCPDYYSEKDLDCVFNKTIMFYLMERLTFPVTDFFSTYNTLANSRSGYMPLYRRGIYFNGVDAHLSLSNSLLLSPGFTFTSWLNIMSQDYSPIIFKTSFGIYFNINSLELQISTTKISLINGVNVGTWYQCIISFDPSWPRISTSLNNIVSLVTTSSDNIISDSNTEGYSLQIGYDGVLYFKGFILTFLYSGDPLQKDMYTAASNNQCTYPKELYAMCLSSCNPGRYPSDTCDYCNDCLNCRRYPDCNPCFDQDCSSCSLYGPNRCSECSSGYLISNQCYSECPITYVFNGTHCNSGSSQEIIFEQPVSFQVNQALTFVSSGQESIQSYGRGTFFQQDSYFSTKAYFAPPNYCIVVWLRLVSGNMASIGLSGKLAFISDFSNILIQQNFASESIAYQNPTSWNIMTYYFTDKSSIPLSRESIFVDIYGNHDMIYSIYINQNLVYTKNTINTDTLKNRTKSNLIIFTSPQSSMFVYYFKLIPTYESIQNIITEFNGCFLVSGLGAGCLGNCNVNQYEDTQQNCVACKPGCKSCINGESCSLCLNGCNSCLAYYDYCCMVTLNEACYDHCPLLYTDNSNYCNIGSVSMLNFNLNTFSSQIKGSSLTDVLNLTTYTLNKYPNFNQILDPHIGYNRGLYFHQKSPVAYLKSNKQFLLSNDYFVGLWIYPETFSGFFSKSSLSLSFTSSGFMAEFYNTTMLTLIRSVSSNTGINLFQWIFVGVGVHYDKGKTSVELYVNKLDSTILLLNDYLNDTYGFMNVGIGANSPTTFKGWIFQVIYSAVYQDKTTVGTQVGDCKDCNCPSNGVCLWTCPVNYYYSFGQCKKCTSIDYCKDITNSLCFFPECYTCGGYSDCGCYSECGIDCHSSCDQCSGGGPFQCISCVEGYLELNGLCLDICPILYAKPNGSKTCVQAYDENFLRYNFHSFSAIVSDPNEIMSFEPTAEHYFAYGRGLYGTKINGGTSVNFSPFFAFSIWIRPDSDSEILRKSTQPTELRLYYSNNQISLQVFMTRQQYSVDCNIGNALKTWTAFSAALSQSQDSTIMKLYVNKNICSTITQKSVYFANAKNVIILGDDSSNSFIYEFSYYSDPNDALNSLSSCSSCTCPMSLGFCLWNCDLANYFDGTKCTKCFTDCVTCRNGNDCSQCAVDKCSNCNDFTSISCNTCQNPLVFQRGVCCDNCDSCYSKCSGCSSPSPFDCTGCLNGVVKYNGKCLDQCPLLYLNNGGVCSGSGGSLMYKFDTFDEVIQDGLGAMKFVNYADSPVFAPNRGKYISVVSQYEKIAVSPFLTFELWVMLLSPGDIMSKSNSITQDFKLFFTSSGSIQISFTSTQSVTTKSVQAILPLSSWCFIALSLQEGQSSTELFLYLNTIQLYHTTLTGLYLVNGNLTSINLGNPLSKSFIYLFTYTSFGKIQSEIQKSIGTCTTCSCPASLNSCLWPCLINQYFNGTSCQPCLSSCTSCRFRTSCTNCANINCLSCLTPADLTCTTCVNNKNYTAFLQGTCECSKGYYVLENDCVACDRWVQSSDLTAIFSDDYLKLFVYFNISVISVSCSDIFDISTAGKFGADYVCTYLDNNIGLRIDLGFGTTLKDEVLNLNSVLKGLQPECGYLNTSLSVKIHNSGPLPLPRAIINAPSSVNADCEDLIILGTNSYGSVLSQLFYQWQVSSPNQNLSKFSIPASSNSSLIIPHASFSPGSISVTLTVFNKFNNSDSVSVSILASGTNSVSIQFSPAINFTCPVANDCVYPIQNITSCNASTEFNVTWKMIKGQETISKEKLESFWAMQTSEKQLLIVNGFFSPQILKFLITANDTVNNLYGERMISIIIMPGQPVIILKPASGSISLTRDLLLDASSSFDRSFTSVNYNWVCIYNDSDCQFNYTKTSAVLSISKEILSKFRFDFINLTVNSIQTITRRLQTTVASKSSAKFTGYYVDNYTPVVYFQENSTGLQPKVVSISKPFIIQAIIEGKTDVTYRYKWIIDTKTPVFLSLDDQPVLIIDTSALNKGSLYNLQFSLTDQIDFTSYFYYNFTTNYPPTSGSLIVSPKEGTEVSTEFYCSAIDWVTSESNYPLLYSFGYVLQDYSVHLSILSQTSSFKTKVPFLVESAGFFVKVFDSLGDYSVSTVKVSMRINPQVNITSLLNQYKEIYATAYPEELPGLIFLLSFTILNRDYMFSSIIGYNSSTSLDQLNECFNLTSTYLEKYIQTNLPTSNLIDQSIELMNTTSYNPNLRSTENLNITAKVFEVLTNATAATGLSTNQAEGYFQVLNNLIDLNATTVYNDTEGLTVLSQSISTIEASLINGMTLNQTKHAQNANFSMDIILLNTSNTNNFVFSASDSSGAGVILPSNMSSYFSTNSSFIALSIVHVNITNTTSTLSNPSIVSVNLYQYPENILLNISLKNSYIDIKIPVNNANVAKNLTCYFLNETLEDWDVRGCKLQKRSKYIVTCRCNHLTFFSAGEGSKGNGFWPKSNFDDTLNLDALTGITANSAIGLYFSVAVIIIYSIFAIITFRLDKAEYLERFTKVTVVTAVNLNNEFEFHGIKSTRRDENAEEEAKERTENVNLRSENDQISIEESTPIKINVSLDDEYQIPEKIHQISLEDENESIKKMPVENNEIKEDENFNKNTTLIEEPKETFLAKLMPLLKVHKYSNIILLHEPMLPKFMRAALLFFDLLGSMYFSGLFYEGRDSGSKSFQQSVEEYTFTDFLIIVYSFLIMAIVEAVLEYFLTLKNMDGSITYNQIRGKNKKFIRIWIGIALCWGAMAYFCWGISLFAIQFDRGISYKWVFGTILNYLIDIFITSFIIAYFKVSLWPKLKKRFSKNDQPINSNDNLEISLK